MAIIIDRNKCPQDHLCPMVDVCPVKAISQKGFDLPVIDTVKCIECGKCIKICGKKATYKE